MASSTAAISPDSQSDRFKLPGFGLPLNFIPNHGDVQKEEVGSLFPNALNIQDLCYGSVHQPLTTLREFTMLHLMNQITDKRDWHEKAMTSIGIPCLSMLNENLQVFDEGIASKWKAEALSATDKDITEKMVDWCIAEVRHKAAHFKKTGCIVVYNGDVVKSDVAIPESLKNALKEGVSSLEDVPGQKLDWHPGSGEKVLDLVHPSLFPLVYGRTRILPDSFVSLDDCIGRSGEGQTLPVPSDEETFLIADRSWGKPSSKPFSKEFQWLPCDVDIVDEGVKITSYINNLHPELHKGLYGVIERIIAHTIPLWNVSLSPLKDCNLKVSRIDYTECVYDPDPEYGPATDGPQQEDGEDEYAYNERRHEWYEATRNVVQPEPETFKPSLLPEHMHEEYYIDGTSEYKTEKLVDLRRDYGQRGLQIIVKLANIHLTPDKPEYEGGTWHVEGQLNEHICASATYYYDSDNITTSRLAFRQQCSADIDEIDYQQNHHDWLEAVFGCEQYGSTLQDIGTVDTTEGRLLTWPNVLQHKVQPFRLADETKAGHRKILALFLVDPNIRIISTANVPCQQRDWWSQAIQKGDSAIPKLPLELQEEIFKNVKDFPIDLEEAKEMRLKLMEERKVYVARHEDEFAQDTFSLCEH
ncbi:hypothetical protein FPV67DRAFT_1672737 [Lyophyllum atratum]|nr:hypothetical protein FPV67DRAFT_1672737 [Lyophyllum atratum]